MPDFVSDYSGDHAFIEGTAQGTLTVGAVVTNYNACRSRITRNDFESGAVVGLAPTDSAFVLWGYAPAEIPIDGTWTWDSVDYVVIGGYVAQDESQTRLFVRERV